MKRNREIPLANMLILSKGPELPSEIQLLPYGWVNSKKGEFLVDDQSIRDIIANASTVVNNFVIDYEHQTLYGKEAPAAGWITKFINKGEQGLWCEVEWTPRATEYLQNKEYRYLSPVVNVRNDDKRAIAFHSAGLTNTPAIDGMIPIANKFGDDPEEDQKSMDELLKKLIAALGLSAEATPDEIWAALATKLSGDQVVANKEVLTMLGLPADAPFEHVKGKLLALNDKSAYVSKSDFDSLQNRLNQRESNESVTLALKAGKITPAQQEWATQYALKDPIGFKTFVDNQPQIVPLGADIVSNNTLNKPTLDDSQLSINKMLGVSTADFKKEWGEQ